MIPHPRPSGQHGTQNIYKSFKNLPDPSGYGRFRRFLGTRTGQLVLYKAGADMVKYLGIH